MNQLTDRQHLENIAAIVNKGGYVSEITYRIESYMVLHALIPVDGSRSYYISPDELDKLIPHKMEAGK